MGQSPYREIYGSEKNIPNFDMSEPEFLIRIMDRHLDWCAIVCLVGGGQEINAGEAGLTEWPSQYEGKGLIAR